MKSAPEQYITIRHPNQLLGFIDVVPLKHTCDGETCEGIVLTPGAGISRVTFKKQHLCSH